ncbi:uncharacterized protein LOC143126248 [Alosa pseudoharengus]|uniref:uncharacterized protein LOC143126248 n=1 Tax=Alosa pseudoharengus TaxID=34774 RepID=UPI003F8A2C18
MLLDMITMTVQFILLLSVVVNVSFQTADVNPACIYGTQTQALEGEDVKFKCTLSDLKKNKAHSIMYLCKNGIGMYIEEFRLGEVEVSFKLLHVNVSYTGNYSCVYSKTKYDPKHVSSTDKNVTVITLVVTSKPRPTSMLKEAVQAANSSLNTSLFLLLLLLPLGCLIMVVWYYWYILKIWFYRRYTKRTRIYRGNRASRITSPSISARTPPPNSPISNEECNNGIVYANVKVEQAPEESTYANTRSD